MAVICFQGFPFYAKNSGKDYQIPSLLSATPDLGTKHTQTQTNDTLLGFKISNMEESKHSSRPTSILTWEMQFLFPKSAPLNMLKFRS